MTTSILTVLAVVLGNGVTRPGPVGDDDAAAGDVDLGHQRRHERHQGVAPVGRADLEQVLGAPCTHAGHLAERRAVQVVRRAARPAGGRSTPRGPPGVSSAGTWATCSTMPRAASAALRSATSSKRTSSVALVPAGAPPRSATSAGWPSRRAARRGSVVPGGEAAVRLVGAYVDGDLAAEAVRLADPADDDLDVSSLSTPVSVEPGRRRTGATPWGDTRVVVQTSERLSGGGRRRRSRSARRRGPRGPR